MIDVIFTENEKAFEYESTFDYLLKDFHYNKRNINDDPKTFNNKTLIIYSSLNEFVPKYIDDFVKQLNCEYILFHMSNEWDWAFYPQLKNFSDTINETKHYYGNASHVFRNYWNPMFDCDIVTHLPIFWQNGFLNNASIIENVKTYKTAFIGNPKNDRPKVIDIMEKMGDCYVHKTSGWLSEDIITVDKQSQVYSKTVICPCPMGGCHPEVFRMCEILESKSIPVIVEYFDFEYHNRIYGYDSPIPRIKRWEDLPKVYNDIIKRGVYQATENIHHWYQDWKIRTKYNFQKILLS
jgi:hypothetical protein